MALRKGDGYSLSVRIRIDGANLGTSGVDIVEFMFDDIRKVYGGTSTDGVTFDTDHFVVPFTQEETFSLNKKTVQYQARVKFDTGEVKGTAIKVNNVYGSLSKEVL